MKIAIAGLGSIGRRHLRNLRILGESDILLYRTFQGTLPDEELAGFHSTTELDEVLSWKPDAMIISNPTSAHLSVAIPAARAGCHLLIEKPLSNSLNGIDRLQVITQKHSVRVLVGFQFRFHPVLNQVKTLLDSGDIGQVLSVHAHWGEYLPGWHPWENYRQGYSARSDLGGGVVLTLSHPFDYLRWLIGDVISLSALVSRVSNLDIDVEDQAETILKFSQGPIGTVHLDYFQRPASHWFEIVTTAGLIHWDNFDGIAHLVPADGKPEKVIAPPGGFERNDLFMEEMRHFLNLVNGTDQVSRCSLADGEAALKIALGVLESSADASRQVSIN